MSVIFWWRFAKRENRTAKRDRTIYQFTKREASGADQSLLKLQSVTDLKQKPGQETLSTHDPVPTMHAGYSWSVLKHICILVPLGKKVRANIEAHALELKILLLFDKKLIYRHFGLWITLWQTDTLEYTVINTDIIFLTTCDIAIKAVCYVCKHKLRLRN